MQFNRKKPKNNKLDIEISELLEEQKKDKLVRKIFNELRNKWQEAETKFKNYVICPTTKLLLFVKKPIKKKTENNNKIVFPSNLKEKCLKISHLTHFGIDKTYRNLDKKHFCGRACFRM